MTEGSGRIHRRGSICSALKTQKIGEVGNGMRQGHSERGVRVNQGTGGKSACSDQV